MRPAVSIICLVRFLGPRCPAFGPGRRTAKAQKFFNHAAPFLKNVYICNEVTKNITRHINNAFRTNEIDKKSNVRFLHIPLSDKPVMFYSLDVIIAVGYRVKSQRGTDFRKWAIPVIKNHMLYGCAVKQRFERLEQRLSKTEEKIDFFVKTALPPIEGIFYDGQIFDAYVFASDLIRRAKQEIILIDNYIDETVLTMLNKRNNGVKATIYTANISKDLKLDLKKHNYQYQPIDIKLFKDSHDRFLIIDNEIFHIGASLKDLGKKLFAFSKLNIEKEMLLHFTGNC
jgi:hypothetical protein